MVQGIKKQVSEAPKKLKVEWSQVPTERNFNEWFKNCGIEICVLVTVIASIAIIPHIPDNTPVFKFIKQCPFHTATGLSCPSCGMTRAAGALVSGHFMDALRYNPFIYLITGFLFYRLLQRIMETFLKKYPVFLNIPIKFYVLLFSSYILFGVWRIISELKGIDAL